MFVLHVLVLVAVIPPAAGQDNNVEWSGISHVTFNDRTPMCPIGGETFAVRVQSWSNDLTSVCVHVDDGIAPATCVSAVMIGARGPYDVYQAMVPSTASSAVAYYFELSDGTDTDYLGANGMTTSPPVGSEFQIDYATLSHAPLGATVHPNGGTVFKVWAPNPTSANVRGEFNAWGLANPMTRVGEYFTAYVAGAGPDDMYKYYFNPGDVWKPDPRARALNPGDNYNARVKDAFAHGWGDAAFQTPAFEDMVIYELHVGTFSGRNDGGSSPPNYRDVVDLHLDHLVELGVNVVELMPVTEFPWDYSAGYNPVSQWSPEAIWGTPDDLKYMIDTLHQNGIAVVHDIVWNHFSPSDNYCWQFDGNQIYFDSPAVDTPWGAQADFDNDEVRRYYVDSAHHWLEEFHFDGYRMDATDFMNPYQTGGWSLMQWFNDDLDRRWADKITIAEQLPDDAWVTRPTSLGGAGFDSQWHDRFTDDVRAQIFNASFSGASMTTIRGAILGSGTYLENQQVVNYIETHDEAWPDSGGQRMVVTIDPTAPNDDVYARGRTMVGHAIAMYAPGIPMFLQGCEFLENTGFGASAPAAPEARLDWNKTTTYAGYLAFFQDMIAIRRTNDGFKANAPVQVSHLNESGDVLAMRRWSGGANDLVVVYSLNNNDLANYQIGFPQSGRWYVLLNSQSSTYGGNGIGNGPSVVAGGGAYDGFAQSAAISVPRMSVQVFRHDDPPCSFPDIDRDGDAVGDLDDFARFQQCFGNQPCAHDADFNDDGIVDLGDYAVFSGQASACP